MMNFFRVRYQKGLRGKGATEAGAAVRKYFMIKLLDTEWMDDPQVSNARKACRRSPEENREFIRAGAGRDKKPIWYDLLGQIREEYWEDKVYGVLTADRMMTYICAMFSYDMALRKGEANASGEKEEDHTIRNEDVTFTLREPISIGGEVTYMIRGGSEEFRSKVTPDNVESCHVGAVTHKVGLIRAGKVIGRRTIEEEGFLEDLVQWVLMSGAGPRDPLFSRYLQFPGKLRSLKKCTGKMITKAIKEMVLRAGMDPGQFAFHSVRKAAITQLKAHGIVREEANARGNYSRDSVMVNTVYNSNEGGRGPLASSSSGLGRRIEEEDIRRVLGAKYSDK
jgi:hypothetical protein